MDMKPRINVVFVLLLILSGCSSIKRKPPPTDAYTLADFHGIPHARLWGDNPPVDDDSRTDLIKTMIATAPDYAPENPVHFLAISGGAQEGAFGAGILAGWTKAGTRPKFRMVTGISSGSLLAPFAFLGPDYDFAMKELFSEYDTKAVLDTRYFSAIFRGASLSDNKKLRKILMNYFTPVEMEKMAAEYALGRKLYIGTTHLDTIRPVIWDIGAIAASGHEQAYTLIIDVIMASAAFPGVFPPVLFDVEQHGKPYQEMHVDGGLTSQVFSSPVGFNITERLEDLGLNGPRHLYILRNATILPESENISPNTIPILKQTAYSMVNSMALMDMEYMYLYSKDHNISFNLAFIPAGVREPEEPYDPPYMKELFQLGFDAAKNGYPWANTVPDLSGEDEAPILTP